MRHAVFSAHLRGAVALSQRQHTPWQQLRARGSAGGADRPRHRTAEGGGVLAGSSRGDDEHPHCAGAGRLEGVGDEGHLLAIAVEVCDGGEHVGSWDQDLELLLVLGVLQRGTPLRTLSMIAGTEAFSIG